MEKNPAIERIIAFGVAIAQHPMDCNMFDKKCAMLTCHMKLKCLWTKEEVQELTKKDRS